LKKRKGKAKKLEYSEYATSFKQLSLPFEKKVRPKNLNIQNTQLRLSSSLYLLKKRSEPLWQISKFPET